MSTSIKELKERVQNFAAIPANEQCLGHFHVAVQSALLDILEHVEKLEKLCGVERP